MKYFTEEEKNKLAGMLINFSIKDLYEDEDYYLKDKNQEGAMKVQKVSDAIDTILEYLDKAE